MAPAKKPKAASKNTKKTTKSAEIDDGAEDLKLAENLSEGDLKKLLAKKKKEAEDKRRAGKCLLS
jgi:hypothetical protein